MDDGSFTFTKELLASVEKLSRACPERGEFAHSRKTESLLAVAVTA
jgi:hypothetical protein